MSKKLDWVDLYARARWDRLAGAAVVLVLLIIVIVAMCGACGKKDDVPANTNVQTTLPTQLTTEAEPDNSRAVYLSPSTQYDNLYACDNKTSEKDAMIDLANRVKALLEADGYTVYMCGPEYTVKTKVDEGNTLRCGAYVALHSNSGGESGNGQGTECFYNSNVTGSRELAECVYNKMAALTPTEDRGLKDETSMRSPTMRLPAVCLKWNSTISAIWHSGFWIIRMLPPRPLPTASRPICPLHPPFRSRPPIPPTRPWHGIRRSSTDGKA